MNPSTAIIVFARAPQPGHVKTRLIPTLGAQGALDLYRAMLRHALQVAQQCAVDELILACTPDTQHPELQSMGRAVGATLQAQEGDDLGARMHHALCAALRRHQIALLIGSDCPSLRSVDLCAARDRLLVDTSIAGTKNAVPNEMVFIPANDGGYVLVGGTKSCAAIFRNMPWGSDEVMMLTRQRLRDETRKWHELPARNDIDRAEDLALLDDRFDALITGAPKF